MANIDTSLICKKWGGVDDLRKNKNVMVRDLG